MTKSATRMVLVRHGESNTTVARVIGGYRTCTGLSPLGRKQAEALAARLVRTGEITADLLVASNFPRAIETAEIISPSLGDLPVVVDPEVGEHDPGPDFDGVEYEAYLEQHGFPDWENDPFGVSFAGGETVAEFHHRVGRGLHRLVEGNHGGTVVVVCHGGVIDATFRTLLRLPMTGAFELRTTNTSLTELVRVRPGRWQLARYNDAAHLDGLPLETPRS